LGFSAAVFHSAATALNAAWWSAAGCAAL